MLASVCVALRRSQGDAGEVFADGDRAGVAAVADVGFERSGAGGVLGWGTEVGEDQVAYARLVGQCPEGHRLGMVPGDSLERRAGEVAGQSGDPADLVDQDVGAGGQVGDFVADDGVAGDDDGPVGGSDPVGDGAVDWPMVYLDGVYGDGAVGAVPD